MVCTTMYHKLEIFDINPVTLMIVLMLLVFCWRLKTMFISKLCLWKLTVLQYYQYKPVYETLAVHTFCVACVKLQYRKHPKLYTSLFSVANSLRLFAITDVDVLECSLVTELFPSYIFLDVFVQYASNVIFCDIPSLRRLQTKHQLTTRPFLVLNKNPTRN